MNVPEYELVWMCLGCEKPVEGNHLRWSDFGLPEPPRSTEWINFHRREWDYLEMRPTNISLCVGEMR